MPPVHVVRFVVLDVVMNVVMIVNANYTPDYRPNPTQNYTPRRRRFEHWGAAVRGESGAGLAS